MSLGGLTLGIGMLVDNSIVVLESIFRTTAAGAVACARAAVDGTTEVGGAVMASTLTTVAVFLPIVFVEGDRRAALPRPGADGDLQPAGLAGGRGHHDPHAERRWAAARRAGDRGPGADEGVDRSRRRRARADPGPVLAASTIGCCAARCAALADPGRRPSRCSRPRCGRSRLLGTELIPQLSEGEFFFEVKLPEGAVAGRHRPHRSRRWSRPRPPSPASTATTPPSAAVWSPAACRLNTKAENLGQLNVVHDGPRRRRRARLAVAERLRRRFARHPRPGGQVRPALLLQPQDPGRGASSSARTSSSCATTPWTLARRLRGRPRPGGRALLAGGGQPRAAGGLRPRAAGRPGPGHGRRSRRPCTTACRARCPPASRRRTARSTSASATARRTAQLGRGRAQPGAARARRRAHPPALGGRRRPRPAGPPRSTACSSSARPWSRPTWTGRSLGAAVARRRARPCARRRRRRRA